MKTIVLTAVACLLVLPQIARADDLVTPPWRGQPGTTGQVWEFLTSQATDVYPDGTLAGALPPGPSTRIFYITPNSGAGWLATDMGRDGVWPLSGQIEVHVENYILPNPWKEMWVQITWRPELTGGQPQITDLYPGAASPPQLIQEVPLETPWMHSTFSWLYSPNPDYEDFLIAGNINVAELIVETHCYVPEPTTMGLLAFGAVAIAARRRR